MGANAMKTRSWIGLSILVVVLSVAAFFGYRKWGVPNGAARADALALMPTDASAVLFADFDELRQAPFFAKFYAWAPKPEADPDYAQFVKETGFDYERSLDRVAIAMEKRAQDSALLAILDGKFDRQKISAYALKAGSSAKTGGREIFSVTLSEGSKKISSSMPISAFSFAKKNELRTQRNGTCDSIVWRARQYLPWSARTPQPALHWLPKLPVVSAPRSFPRCSTNCSGSRWQESRRTIVSASSPRENARRKPLRGNLWT